MEGPHRMISVSNCVNDVLKRGLDDWVDAAELAHVVRSNGCSTPTEVREIALMVIAELLHNELMQVGDVTYDGFKEWSVTSTEALDRIAREWNSGKGPNLGEICWLSNTEEGDRRAKSVL